MADSRMFESGMDGCVGVKQEDPYFDLPTDDERNDAALPDVCTSSSVLIKSEYQEDDYSTDGEDEYTVDIDSKLKIGFVDQADVAVKPSASYSNTLHDCSASRSAGSLIHVSTGEGGLETEGLTQEQYDVIVQNESPNGGLKTAGQTQEDYDMSVQNEPRTFYHEADVSYLSGCVFQSEKMSDGREEHSGRDAYVAFSAIDGKHRSSKDIRSNSAAIPSASFHLSSSSSDSLIDETVGNQGKSVNQTEGTGVTLQNVSNNGNIHAACGGFTLIGGKKKEARETTFDCHSVETPGRSSYPEIGDDVKCAIAIARARASIDDGYDMSIDTYWKSEDGWDDRLHRGPNKFPYFRGVLQQKMWAAFGRYKRFVPSLYADRELYEKRSILDKAIATLHYSPSDLSSSGSDSSEDDEK